MTLAGVYDIDPARVRAAADDGIPVYPTLSSLLQDKGLDGVVIAVPNDCHRQLVLACLSAGKHVICEKPVEMSVKALDDMIDAAHRVYRLFTVHQNRRWDVDFLAMQQIVRSEEIGKILHIESRVHGSRGIPSDWRATRAHGGGMLLDWGVHLIDQILQIIEAPIVGIYCTMTHITTEEVDDGFCLTITFAGGATAYIEVGTYNFIPMPRFYLQCTKGSAVIEDWRKCARVAKLKAWCEKDVLPVMTAAGITKTMAPRDEVTLDGYEVERPSGDVQDFYRNFAAAMDGKAALTVTHEQIRRVMRVIELAFASAEKQQVLHVDDL